MIKEAYYMQVIKTNTEWTMVFKCTGDGFKNRHKPCGYNLIIEKKDIVRMEYTENNEIKIMYGFICVNCHCFTKIDSKLVPDDAVFNCPTVASKNTTIYSQLSVEEKVLSNKL